MTGFVQLRPGFTLLAAVVVAACTGSPSMPQTAMPSESAGTVPTVAPPASSQPASTPAAGATAEVLTGPTLRGYHQLVTVGGDLGIVMIGGFTLFDDWPYGRPPVGQEHPARTPDALWAFTSERGWMQLDSSDRLFATDQVNDAVYHPRSGRILMYVAETRDPSSRLYDTARGTVTVAEAAGPSGLLGPMLAYDAESDRIVLFGGLYNDDTWAYDMATDTWTRMDPPNGPPVLNYGAMAYDPEADRVILFGGGDASRNYGQTWTYDLNSDTWTDMSPTVSPSARTYTAMAHDAVGKRMILFGGVLETADERRGEGWVEDGVLLEWNLPAGDTWSYDLATNTWADLAPATAPGPRGWHELAYESETGLIVLFGGGPGRGKFTDETWVFDPGANSWTKVPKN